MSGDTFDFLQGNRETLTGTLHDPAATPGDVLTVQPDGSVAAVPGGGSQPVTPDQIDNLGLWLKIESLGAHADGDPISAWPDSSGNSRDFSAVDGADASYSDPGGVPVGVAGSGAAFALSTGLDLFSDLPGFTIGFRARTLATSQENVIYALDVDSNFLVGLDIISTASAADQFSSLGVVFGTDAATAPVANAQWFARGRTTGVVSIEPKGVNLQSEPSPQPAAYTVGGNPGRLQLGSAGPVYLPPFFAGQQAGVEDESGTPPADAGTIGLFTPDGSTPSFAGVLCELVIYQRILTAGERRELFEYLSSRDAA